MFSTLLTLFSSNNSVFEVIAMVYRERNSFLWETKQFIEWKHGFHSWLKTNTFTHKETRFIDWTCNIGVKLCFWPYLHCFKRITVFLWWLQCFIAKDILFHEKLCESSENHGEHSSHELSNVYRQWHCLFADKPFF